MNCRSCRSLNLKQVLDLGCHAWCNDFVERNQLGKENVYPLNMVRCKDCTLVQLDYTVPKESMFNNHSYVSQTTTSLSKHFFEIAHENVGQFGLHPDDCILDIGGNDGTQLLQYRNLGFSNLLNVESATNIAKMSQQQGIRTINAYFNEDLIPKLPKCKVINASGVFFHLEELHSVIRTIKTILYKNGVFIVQFMYLGDMLKNGAFDGIYHEHLCYYSLQSLINLLKPYQLYVADAYHSDIHGGSIIAKIQHYTPFMTTTKRSNEILMEDRKLVNEKTMKGFVEQVPKIKKKLHETLHKIKQGGHAIFGLGAPAKGNTLLTYCELNNSIIGALLEVNDLKIGLYSPLTHIPVIKEDIESLPDNSYLLVLSWNFFEEIYKKISHLTKPKNIKFIIPFPEIRIVS